MLKAFVQEIVKMAGPKTFEKNGEFYASERLVRIDPRKDMPDKIVLTSLSSICDMVRNEAADLFTDDQILIQVDKYNHVNVFTTLDGEMDRCALYGCCADTPNVCTGAYMGHENAVIQLRSLYIPNEDSNYLLSLLSCVSQESKVSSKDNGVSQSIEAKTGIALTERVDIKPRVKLQPFRTFLEVDQPESEFIIRLDGNGNIGLFEADGGVWKLEAVRNIAAYLSEQLADLVESGRVVVLR